MNDDWTSTGRDEPTLFGPTIGDMAFFSIGIFMLILAAAGMVVIAYATGCGP